MCLYLTSVQSHLSLENTVSHRESGTACVEQNLAERLNDLCYAFMLFSRLGGLDLQDRRRHVDRVMKVLILVSAPKSNRVKERNKH